MQNYMSKLKIWVNFGEIIQCSSWCRKNIKYEQTENKEILM